MKVSKIIKPLIILLFGHLSIDGWAKKIIPVYNYNDTVIELKGYSVELRNTYLRKNLFLRTSVVINNKSDNFLLISPKDILFSTEKLKNTPSLYKKTIVVPPHYTKKVELKFNGSDYTSKVVNFNFSKVKASYKAELIYNIDNIELEKGGGFQSGNITLKIVDKKILPDALVVVTVVDYAGFNLLAINYNNIGLHQINLPACYNLKRKSGQFNFSPNRDRETIKFIFSRDCVMLNGKEKTLSFTNVFTEYSTTTLEGFTMSLRLVSEGNEEEEKDKKGDIEEID